MIKILPPVLNRKYNKNLDHDRILELKAEYGFTPGKKLILITSGGEGIARGIDYVKAIRKREVDVEIAFVCGKNRELKRAAERVAARFPGHVTRVYGFVDFMYELMNMADLVITKAGPATVLEALILGKPLIVTKYIYGQERGNMEYVVQNRLGYYLPRPDAVGERVKWLIDNPEKLTEITRHVLSSPIRNGTDQIADYIMTFDK
jgi:processive 1,2-diacylglycerol beta-glucosyltransferase/1,2-diacylglycerol 3-beta-galactosyltransferase